MGRKKEASALDGLERLTNDRELAKVMGVTASELMLRVKAGELPQPIKTIGRRSYWETDSLLASFGVRLVPINRPGKAGGK